MTTYTYLESPLGELLLTSRDEKLSGLYFADQPHAPRIGPDWIRQDESDAFVQTRQQIEEYASGERKRFDLPLEIAGTPFQEQVWREIAAIPFGQTLTYGELARRIGSARAVRAAGTATGANRLSWIIPCHRVVGHNGALTGYAGGLPRKTALLDFEARIRKGESTILAPAERRPALA